MNNNVIEKANKVVEAIKLEGIGAETMIKENNGVEKIGITVGDGIVRPTLYPDFESNTVDEIVSYILDGYEEAKKDGAVFEDVANRFLDFEYVKSNIIPCVVRDAASDVVSRKYLDLYVVYRFIIPNHPASVLIRQKHIDSWGVTEEDIYNIAKENAKDKYIDIDMSQIIGVEPGSPLRVVMFKDTKSFGSSALLFPELFEKYGNGVKIIPSSIHELLVITEDTTMANELSNMIKEVNSTSVLPEEVLADHPYVYENGEIKAVS